MRVTRFGAGRAALVVGGWAVAAMLAGQEASGAVGQPGLSPAQRLERLQELFGPAVRIGPLAAEGTTVPATATFRFDTPGDLAGFAVVRNDWEIREGFLHGSGVGVSQIVCLLPLGSSSCVVEGRYRSSHVLEVSLLDPLSERYDGTRAVGRLHFGRMDRHSVTDWVELSSRDQPLATVYDLRFPPGFQTGRLQLADGALQAAVTVDGGVKRMTGRVRRADLSPTVMASLAGSINNRVEVDELELRGLIDLAAERTSILTGQGGGFWADGREVTLFYRARGHFRRLLLNGEVVARQPATPGVWWPVEGPLHRASLRLRPGDVLAFDLAGVDDECALHAVAVDRTTGRVVLATHPLTFLAAAAQPDDSWYRRFDRAADPRPGLSGSQDASVVRALFEALGRDFPGLPINGPAVDRSRCVYLKTLVH